MPTTRYFLNSLTLVASSLLTSSRLSHREDVRVRDREIHAPCGSALLRTDGAHIVVSVRRMVCTCLAAHPTATLGSVSPAAHGADSPPDAPDFSSPTHRQLDAAPGSVSLSSLVSTGPPIVHRPPRSTRPHTACHRA